MKAADARKLLILVAAFFFAGLAPGSNTYQIKRNYNLRHLRENPEWLVTLGTFAVLAFAPELWGPHYAEALFSIGLGFMVVLCLRPTERWTHAQRRPVPRSYTCTWD